MNSLASSGYITATKIHRQLVMGVRQRVKSVFVLIGLTILIVGLSVASIPFTAAEAASVLNPVADTRLHSDNPTGNYGGGDMLEAEGTTSESLLKFDVPAGNGPITSAKLRLYAISDTDDSVAVYATDNDWTETGVTWNTKPARGALAARSAGPVAPRLQYHEWDVTSAVTHSGTLSFNVVDEGNDQIWLSSREHASVGKPELVITRGTTPPATPLRWASPALTDPTTINLGTGRTESLLDTTKDYILVMPDAQKTGPTIISGGRNVVIKGGYQTLLPDNSGVYCSQAAFCIRDGTGTLHIEGVHIDNSGGSDFDAFDIKSPESIVQLENIRVDGLTGSMNGMHSDIVQPWGGVKELRIDRLSGSSNYQGLFLQPEPAYGAIGPISLSHIDIAFASDVAVPGSNQLIWLTTFDTCITASAVTMEEVYVTPKPGASLGQAVYPDTGGPAGCPVQIDQNTATWPGLSTVTGSVKLGPPAGGNFVAAGVAGLSYQLPGYR